MKKKPGYNSTSDETNTPSVVQIENLLGSIQPNPSQRFHSGMENQPWRRDPKNSLMSWLTARNQTTIILVSIFLGLVVILATPSLDVVANRIAQFFTTSPTDQVSIDIPKDDTQFQTNQLNDSIIEASQKAGFSIHMPNQIPDGFRFQGAGYNDTRKVVTLSYESDDGSIIRISQRPEGVEYQSISVNAKVEQINIGPYSGEYVEGSWKVVEPNLLEPQSTVTVTLKADWNPKASTQFLRWQQMNMLIEIIYNGSSDAPSKILKKSDLIALAESFQ